MTLVEFIALVCTILAVLIAIRAMLVSTSCQIHGVTGVNKRYQLALAYLRRLSEVDALLSEVGFGNRQQNEAARDATIAAAERLKNDYDTNCDLFEKSTTKAIHAAVVQICQTAHKYCDGSTTGEEFTECHRAIADAVKELKSLLKTDSETIKDMHGWPKKG